MSWSFMGVVRLVYLLLGIRLTLKLKAGHKPNQYLVAEWIHFTLLGIISPTIKLTVYTVGGL